MQFLQDSPQLLRRHLPSTMYGLVVLVVQDHSRYLSQNLSVYVNIAGFSALSKLIRRAAKGKHPRRDYDETGSSMIYRQDLSMLKVYNENEMSPFHQADSNNGNRSRQKHSVYIGFS